MIANIVTTAETDSSLGQVETLANALRLHVDSSHSTSHTGNGHTMAGSYTDSRGHAWPSAGAKVLVINVGGTDYYVPVKQL